MSVGYANLPTPHVQLEAPPSAAACRIAGQHSTGSIKLTLSDVTGGRKVVEMTNCTRAGEPGEIHSYYIVCNKGEQTLPNTGGTSVGSKP